MALFTQSTKAVSAACQEIADAVGVSGDTEWTDRAFRSLRAGFQYLNRRANWEFLDTESAPISVVAPFSVGGVTASAGSTSALAPASHGLLPDDVVTFPGVLLGTRVSATAAGSFTITTTIGAALGTGNQVVTASATRDAYPLPSDWKAVYGVRLHGSPRTLVPIRRRAWDRAITTEFQTSTPFGYDLFMIGGKGKLRLLPPPSQADVLQYRYYRRMTVPTTSATAEPLDIPDDFEGFLIAWCKWHLINDKGEGRAEQGQTWLTFANEGIRTMIQDQTVVPDEDLGFMPGAYTWPWSSQSTTQIDWTYG